MTLLAAACAAGAWAQTPFLDRGPARKFIEADLHVLAGGSYVTNDYASRFSQISAVNASMRFAYGVGAGARFCLRDYLALGTELNVTFNASRMDMAVTSQESPRLSTVFLRNRYRYLDIPVYVRLSMNPGTAVRWHVDVGAYYAYGLGGTQRSTIFNAQVNDLGQLLTTTELTRCDYFNDSRAFINSYYRGDWGLHLATGLTFNRRLSVSLRTHVGLRNVANTRGIVHPSCRNFDCMGSVGWTF